MTALRPAVPLALAAVLLAAVGGWGLSQHRMLEDSRRQLAAVAPSAFDIGFVHAMVAHHRQAIAMAQVLLAGPPSALAPMARGILATQTVELGEMRGWLRLWSQPLEVLRPPMDWMLLAAEPLDAELRQYLLDCAASPTGMSGLADEATIEAWRHTPSPQRETQFVALMNAHHRGALPMAQHAARHAPIPAVRALARQIVMEQRDELRLLDRLHEAQPGSAE